MSVRTLKIYAVVVTMLAAYAVVGYREKPPTQGVNSGWSPAESREVHKLVLNQLRALK